MFDHKQHDCAFAITWRVMEFLKGAVPEDELRDVMEEVYLIAQQEALRYERAETRNVNVAGKKPV